MQGAHETNALEPFAPARKSARLVPVLPVTVAVLDHGLPFAYGVVANISESGACVQTGDVCSRRSIQLMLSFSDGEMLEANGRVVWSKPVTADGSQALCGIEFTGLPEGIRETLRTKLDSTLFTASDR